MAGACGGPVEQGCCSADTNWRATSPLLPCTAIAARGPGLCAPRGIAKCKVQIAKCKLLPRRSTREHWREGCWPPALNFQFSICNFQFHFPSPRCFCSSPPRRRPGANARPEPHRADHRHGPGGQPAGRSAPTRSGCCAATASSSRATATPAAARPCLWIDRAETARAAAAQGDRLSGRRRRSASDRRPSCPG